MSKVFICGNYGTGGQTTSGQVIKTKIVTEEIVKKLGKDNCTVFNTYNRTKSLLAIFFVILPTLFRYKQVVLFPAQRGVMLLLPAFFISKMLFHTKLHYIVIGGWLPSMTTKKPLLRKIAKKYDYIYVETKTMERSLQEQGFNNVVIVPNVKNLEILDVKEFHSYYTAPPYRLCTFSRVMKQKGIEDIISAVREINETRNDVIYELDIYGKIEDNEIEWFNKIEKTMPNYCKYKGMVSPNESTKVIKDYYLLVFPTLFYTEGIPGTIIDAYASGVPVLSSRWESFEDIIDDGVTGFGYEFGNYQALKDRLMDFSNNPTKVNELKINCCQKANYYLASNVMNYLKLE